MSYYSSYMIKELESNGDDDNNNGNIDDDDDDDDDDNDNYWNNKGDNDNENDNENDNDELDNHIALHKSSVKNWLRINWSEEISRAKAYQPATSLCQRYVL